MTIPFSPGDAYVAEFAGVHAVKPRPVVLLSSVRYHATRPDVIIGLITGKTAAAMGPTDCYLEDWKAAGLRAPSASRAFIVTAPRPAIIKRIGTLSGRDWTAVRQCVKIALFDLIDAAPG